jgi:hypothetical protein
MYIPVTSADVSVREDIQDLVNDANEAAPRRSVAVRPSWLSHLALSRHGNGGGVTSEAFEGAHLLAPPSPTVAEVPVLDHWEVLAHVYKDQAAAKLSILGGLFSGSGKAVNAGVVHEAKRYYARKADDGTLIETGVAVRLIAATSDWKAEAELTLPNIAAEASLHSADARVRIDVLGYSGPLGTLLPAPKQLDVTTCAEYLQAFANIQAQVFSEQGLPFITPTVIAYNEQPVEDATRSE